MTGSEIVRLRSQLSRLEGLFPGYTAEIVEGSIVLTPLRPFHNGTMFRVWKRLAILLPADVEVISGVAVPVSEDSEFCPDLAVIPREEWERNASGYPVDLIHLVVEIVSPSSVRNDYEVKDREYARAGIPAYLIFDPYRAHCVTHWNPGPDGYRGRDTIAYGDTVSVKTPLGELSFDTTELPVDPGARG
ncbi:Uma2 family endonuclease [Streptomyces alkaliterrae]|uniref:Uma2 family endonuclease n=1 Tax=Streptomyces alkaliterrae TaxID=2213162 RepID=A0A5P0YV29_9ACTN|nr:Uma2 family endonuclease [Streptomyces alkaliterrae]MBB1257399.1 Uma2 family endonuclease [Streptomyces alkaliterrae]MQS03332.1 Uma2 family endonuclease [Streptomyces alkaliterrae]